MAVSFLMLPHAVLAGGWLGLTVHPPQGVQVADIFKESPADRSGLKRGDLIRAIDTINLRSVEHFAEVLANTTAGKEVTLTLWRRGEEIKIRTTLESGEEHPSSPPTATSRLYPARPGTEAPAAATPAPTPTPPFLREKEERGDWSSQSQSWEERFPPPTPTVWLGIASNVAPGGISIVDVAPHSPAEQADLRAGDLLVAINRQAVNSPEALVQMLTLMRPGDLVEVAFKREGRTLMSQVQLQKAPTNP
ncbi:MAG: PDZ domain-containing protein [Magnetococcales bacterium]|nr:PDZ domain-containing protein [Magnetococcales bacterium]